MTPEINPTVLESVRNDVAQVSDDLKAIALQVIEEGISEYPIFVAAQEIIPFGRQIFDRDEVSLNWFFYASLLEEFMKKDLISKEGVKGFQKAYNDPRERACVFIFTPEVAQFVFVPYDISKIEEEMS
ncbi:MAG: hypothetical protein MRZ79_22435 [Bacteroidia bacterium]|nr:hypothetical protein [Bacteroidia bacterium]